MIRRLAAIFGVTLMLVASRDGATRELVPVAQPGPWPHISSLIGYGGRLWFVNSRKFVDHNSADIYSYNPRSGHTRYERHLFSQDAGDPVVFAGLLYWPYEDPRFSMRRGEFSITDGVGWQWRSMAVGEAFHVHAMAGHGGALWAAISAWQAGLLRSDDRGASWTVVYEHPTPAGEVTRITTLASDGKALYAGLTTTVGEDEATLLRLEEGRVSPVETWPRGASTSGLVIWRGHVYALHDARGARAVWRSDGGASQRIAALDGAGIRALAAGEDALWAASAERPGGALWRSDDGVDWSIVQRFTSSMPVAIGAYGGAVYVGAEGANGRGELWGPAPPAGAGSALTGDLPLWPAAAPEPLQGAALAALDRTLEDPAALGASHGRLLEFVHLLARTRSPEMGAALSERLTRRLPERRVDLFGGNTDLPAARIARWDLMWAIARVGHGRVPLELIEAPWTVRANRSQKYFEPAPAALWAAAEIGQADEATIAALIDRLDRPDDPDWLRGDVIGALAALTGERFGYDIAKWRSWRRTRETK